MISLLPILDDAFAATWISVSACGMNFEISGKSISLRGVDEPVNQSPISQVEIIDSVIDIGSDDLISAIVEAHEVHKVARTTGTSYMFTRVSKGQI